MNYGVAVGKNETHQVVGPGYRLQIQGIRTVKFVIFGVMSHFI